MWLKDVKNQFAVWLLSQKTSKFVEASHILTRHPGVLAEKTIVFSQLNNIIFGTWRDRDEAPKVSGMLG